MKNDKNYTKHIIIFIISSFVLTLMLNALIMPMMNKPKVKETNYSFFLDKLDEGSVTMVRSRTRKSASKWKTRAKSRSTQQEEWTIRVL